MAYHQDNYLPLVWRHYKTYRRALFDVVDVLDIQSNHARTTIGRGRTIYPKSSLSYAPSLGG